MCPGEILEFTTNTSFEPIEILTETYTVHVTGIRASFYYQSYYSQKVKPVRTIERKIERENRTSISFLGSDKQMHEKIY